MGSAAAPSTAGLREAGRQVLASLVEIGHTRLELATVELEEQRVQLARLSLYAACTLFLFFIALVLGAAFIVLSCEPAHRLTALGALTALFLGAAAVTAWRWRALIAAKPVLLHATLDELQRDRAALLGQDRP